MLITCWSVKGGVGTTVLACAMATTLARRRAEGVLVLDLCGDVPHALGLPEPVGPGLAEWLAAGDAVPPDALTRLAIDAGPGLQFVARGTGRLHPDRVQVLRSVVATEARVVVVDAGRLDGVDEPGPAVGRALAALADQSLLVMRPCQLGVFRARTLPVDPTGVVLVREPGRAIGTADIEHVLGLSLVADIAVDPAVARVVDAGLIQTRLPRSFAAALEQLT